MVHPYKDYYPNESKGACFPLARLSEAWTPYQSFGMIFEPEIGLIQGTIFPELVRPYKPDPCSPGWY